MQKNGPKIQTQSNVQKSLFPATAIPSLEPTKITQQPNIVSIPKSETNPAFSFGKLERFDLNINFYKINIFSSGIIHKRKEFF